MCFLTPISVVQFRMETVHGLRLRVLTGTWETRVLAPGLLDNPEQVLVNNLPLFPLQSFVLLVYLRVQSVWG